jgi:uncharacterized protein
MRIVVDTNTATSGLLWQGQPRQIIDRFRARTHTLRVIVALLAELAEVIARPKFAQRIQAAGLSATALVQDYTRLAEIVEPAPISGPVSRDPDDDVVLAAVLAARATLIVSGDQDLLVLGTFADVRILNAAEALRVLTA